MLYCFLLLHTRGQRLHCILIPHLARFNLKGILSIDTRQPNTFPEPGILRSHTSPHLQNVCLHLLGEPYNQIGMCILSYPPIQHFSQLHCGYLTHQLSFNPCSHANSFLLHDNIHMNSSLCQNIIIMKINQISRISEITKRISENIKEIIKGVSKNIVE